MGGKKRRKEEGRLMMTWGSTVESCAKNGWGWSGQDPLVGPGS